MGPTIKRLDTLSLGCWNLQTQGDVIGNVISPHAHRISINHMLFQENRQARSPPTHIDAGRPKFLFIFNQAGQARHIGRGNHPCQLQITALYTMHQILHSARIHGDHMHIGGHFLPDLTARI